MNDSSRLGQLFFIFLSTRKFQFLQLPCITLFLSSIMDFYSSLDSRLLDRDKPTIFEILSANELEKLLTPSVRYILVYYAHRYPRYILHILNHFDTLNLIIRSLIELRYLRNWNSTFIGKFYGLKLVSKTNLNLPSDGSISERYESLRRLKKFQIAGTLIELLFVPYLKEKLDLLYEKLLPSYILKKINYHQSLKDAIKCLFVQLYPKFVLILRLIDISYKILYISGKRNGVSLLQDLFGIEYSRLNNYDYHLNDQRVSSFLALSKKPSIRVRPKSLIESMLDVYERIAIPVKKVGLITADSILPGLVFLLRFLDWWNTSSVSKALSQNTSFILSLNPPKDLPNSLSSIKKVKKHTITASNLCPLCHHPITNPAVIETGYTFCYPCIYNYLRDGNKETGGRCPITGKRLLGAKYSESLGEWKLNGIRRLIL